MALQSWGHSHYWAASSTGSTSGAPSTDAFVSYPLWRPGPQQGGGQSVSIGSLLGGAQDLWDRAALIVKVLPRLWTCTEPDWCVVNLAIDIVNAPIYHTAKQAVRETATKPQMRDHHYWHEVGRIAKAWNWSENIYRRIDANETADRMLRAQGSTSTKMLRELAVELAYHELKATGR